MSQLSSYSEPHGSDRSANRPLSIKEISEEADKYTWDPNIPLKYWTRALEALYREVRMLPPLPRQLPSS